MDDLKHEIHTARRLHESGAGSVLDILVRSSSNAPRMLQFMRDQGVAPILDDELAEPHFEKIDAAVARTIGALLVRLQDGSFRLALADPWNDHIVQRATATLGYMPLLAAVSQRRLDVWIGQSSSANASESEANAVKKETAGGPVVEFVDTAIRAAFSKGASDIHFECSRVGVTVKLRLDGVMTDFAQMRDLQRSEEVISRIKVLAQLDITERRTPQDGRFRFGFKGGSIDLRVSIMPSIFGEDAVLRLLDKAQLRSRDSSVSLDLLGFDAEHADRIRELGGLPHGMLLVTGPTGSGKTTTVYAVISEVNSGLEKIITIEDPVEYELEGVLQIPVNERKGLTFAKGLRSVLRHDPDRILVGEIRDSETADIAVQAALTGHQVVTTVHANSVFDVTGRFRHFGLDMFGFMSSLNGIIVQRLVRRLCPHCSFEAPASQKEMQWMQRTGIDALQPLFMQAKGCDRCHGSGYHGRVVIAEVHVIDDHFRDLVTGQAAVSVLRDHVSKSGVRSLNEQGARMVLDGFTTAAEIKRVIGWL